MNLNILLIHTYRATFIKIDLDILCSKYNVQELYFQHNSVIQLFYSISKSIKGALWADVILVWFGDYHALVAFIIGRLFRRKCVVIASGYDVANMPEIGYGNMRPGWRKWIGRSVFQLAHEIWPVSHFSAQEGIKNARISPAKIKVIYHGIQEPIVTDATSYEKREAVLTVSFINHVRVTLKGLRTFMQVAEKFPETPFLLVGGSNDDSIDMLKAIAPDNVEFLGTLYGSELSHVMSTAKVYVQLSACESFGMAVAEAMMHGCIPVVTDRGSLPEVVGDSGIIVPYNDVSATVDAISQALEFDEEKGKKSKEYILHAFSYEKRHKQLLMSVNELISK